MKGPRNGARAIFGCLHTQRSAFDESTKMFAKRKTSQFILDMTQETPISL